MSALINLPRAAWKRPPCQKVRINTGSEHPYLPHLVGAFVFNPGNGFVDLVTGQMAVQSGNLSFVADSYGISIGGFSSVNFLTLPYITHSTHMTVVLVQRNPSTANTGGHKFGNGADAAHSPWANNELSYCFGSTRLSVPLLNSESINPRVVLLQSKLSLDNSAGGWLRTRNGYRTGGGGNTIAGWSGSPIIGKWNDSWPYNGVVYACLIFKTGTNQNILSFPVPPGHIEEILTRWWLFFSNDQQKTFSIPTAPALTVPTLSSPGVTDITATAARPQVTLTY